MARYLTIERNQASGKPFAACLRGTTRPRFYYFDSHEAALDHAKQLAKVIFSMTGRVVTLEDKT
jgi:hypothetical protein